MIKFFRKIRRKLLDEGNLKRYLLYAVGEIFLVMVGILLALQVNNWNENRKKGNLEQEYLENLLAELDDQIKYCSFALRVTRKKKEQINSLFELINDPNSKSEGIMSSIDSITLVLGNLNPPSNNFSDLINSGKANIIESETRNKISEYFRLFELDFKVINDRVDRTKEFGDNWLSQIDFAFQQGKLEIENKIIGGWIQDKNSLPFLKMTNFYMYRYDTLKFIEYRLNGLKKSAQTLKDELEKKPK